MNRTFLCNILLVCVTVSCYKESVSEIKPDTLQGANITTIKATIANDNSSNWQRNWNKELQFFSTL